MAVGDGATAGAGDRARWRPWAILGAVLTAMVSVPLIALTVVIVLLAVSVRSCDFDAKLGSDRRRCAESGSELVASSVRPGDGAVRRELDRGKSPDTPDGLGNRALACAAMVGNRSSVLALLEAGADATARGTNGGAPIVAAVSGEGRSGNERSESEEVPFVALDDPVRVEIVQLLIAHGAPPNEAISPAAEKGNVAALDALLAAGGDLVGDPTDPTPLVSAAFGGDRPTVQLLLERGADPNAGGQVTMMEAGAAVYGAVAAASQGTGTPTVPNVDLDLVGEVPPVVAAVIQGRLVGGEGILTDLLAANADPNRPAFDRYTALWMAALVRDHAAAFVLKAAGAVPDPPGRESATAVARGNDDAEMLAILAS